MANSQCPKCHGSGRVVSHHNPYDANKVTAGMGMHRCDRCAGQGVIHGASGLGAGGAVNSAHPVIWIFSIFGALVFANAPLFGLNWFVSGFIGLLIGAAIGGVLLSTRIGRIILWALGLGFVVLVLIQVFRG